MAISQEKIEIYKRKLEEERVKLLQNIERQEKITDFGNDVDSGDEEADEAEELSNTLAVAHAIRGRVNQIDNALQKIRNGTYGMCEKCGASLPEELLDAVPESLLCAKCKQASEAK